jgi:prophage antirepressor-like protein
MELIKQIDENVSFNEQNIRIIGTYDEPWFVAKDICSILELPNVTNAIKIIPEKWRDLKLLSTFGGEQNMNIINESGLYKLIMRSNKPVAQKFQEVVCEEILPEIRKKGQYKIQSIIDKNKELEEEKKKVEEEKNKLQEEKNKIEEEKNLRIKNLENKILKKQKRTVYNDKNFIYIVQDEFHKKDRIYIIGKAIDLAQRLSDYNKTRDYEVIYYRNCNSAEQMSHIEKCVLYKLDKYREVSNRDRFILPEDEDLSIFTSVIDVFVDAFNDVDPSVNIRKDKIEDRKETKKEYYEDNKEYLNELHKIYNEEHKDELFVKKYEYNENNKESLKLYNKQYKEDNDEQLKFFSNVYSKKNKEDIENYQKQYRESNSDTLKLYMKEYYKENKDEHADNMKEYRDEYKEEMKEYNKEYYNNNKDEFKKYKQEYYKENKDLVINNSKEYYEKNKEDVLERTKDHYKKNKEKILAYQAEKITCECGMTIQRNYMSKHKKSEIHRLSLENKLNGKTQEECIKTKCNCGHLVRSNFLKRHLQSNIHKIGVKLQLMKVNDESKDEINTEIKEEIDEDLKDEIKINIIKTNIDTKEETNDDIKKDNKFNPLIECDCGLKIRLINSKRKNHLNSKIHQKFLKDQEIKNSS